MPRSPYSNNDGGSRESAVEDGASADANPASELGQALHCLAQRARGGSLTLGGAFQTLMPASPMLLCALLALPFCQPVPVFGLSIPFGAGIAFLATCVSLGVEVALPRPIARRRIPPRFFPLLLRVSARFVGLADRSMRPRLQWAFHPWLIRLWALVVVADAALLSLPLPIPLSNAFPAASVLALCLGTLKRDGVAAMVGLAAFATASLYLVLLWFAGRAVFA